MKHKLNLDIRGPNYALLKKIFKIIDSRETFEILTSFGFKNLDKQVFFFKIIFISMLFGLDIQFILSELESKEKLCKYFNISEVLSDNQVYKIFSLQNPEKLMKALNRILNSKIV